MKGGAELELPPGFRFHPTDEELVNHYLCKRCAGQPISVPIIAEIDLYKFDPWELPEMAPYGEKEWYFFSPRDRKYPNGLRPNRAAGTGYWKATGADKPIGRPKTLAIKKSLVFYVGKAPKGTKTNWIMHEYRLANVDRSAGSKKNLRLDDWVLCRIYNKKGIIERHLPVESELESYPEDVKVKIENYPVDKILTPGQSGTGYGLISDGDLSNVDTYEKSVRNLHTDSSSSGHVLSPGEEVVQSVPNWGNLDSGLDFGFGEFYSLEEHDPLDLLMMDDMSDAFFYPQKPF